MAILKYLVPIVVLAFTGCATVLSGTNQKIPVASSPIGAEVSVNGKPVGKTPLVLELKRKDPATITLQAKGHKPMNVILDRKRTGWFWLIPTIYGIPFLFVDMATGAAYVLEPKELNVDFNPPKKPTTRIPGPRTEIEKTPARESTGKYAAIKPGLGVSRSEVEAFFQKHNWTFKPAAPIRFTGEEREIGEPPVGDAMFELIGPERNITQAYMSVSLSPILPKKVLEVHGVYLIAFIQTVLPTWKEGFTWLGDHMADARILGPQQVIVGDKIVEMKYHDSLKEMSLSAKLVERQ